MSRTRILAAYAAAVLLTGCSDATGSTAPPPPAPVMVASVAVSPAAFVLEIGDARQMSAVVRDAQGNVLQGRAVQWTSSMPSASISAEGLLTALAPGYVTITASSEGKRSSVAATIVTPEPLDYDLIYTKESGSSTNEIYVLDLSGTPAPLRINAGNVSRQPAPSPDGQRIAFAVSQAVFGGIGEQHDIFAVDRNGMNMRQLTTSANFDDSPAWSPSGAKIAYRSMTTTLSPMRSDIYVMNADGTGHASLTGDLQANAMLTSPVWSPDGARIAYASSATDGATTRNGIWVMNADGSNKREITSTTTGFDAMPSWSPDSRQLVFSRYFSGEQDLAIVALSTGQVTRIQLPGLQLRPAWSPDGRFIAFSSQLGPQSVIYTVRPSGADLRLRITSQAWGDAWDAAWIARE